MVSLEFPTLAALYATLSAPPTRRRPAGRASGSVSQEDGALPRSTEIERWWCSGSDRNVSSLAARILEPSLPDDSHHDPSLLRASHIVPWAECESDAQRLDVYNGLLLSALWDAAFDASRFSFTDAGEPLFHPALGETEKALLRANSANSLAGLSPRHLPNLACHRRRAGF